MLLEAAPRGLDPQAIGHALAAHPGVREVHDLHVWEVTSGFPALSAHVLVPAGEDCHARRAELEQLLAERFGLEHTTLQVEHEAEPRPARHHAVVASVVMSTPPPIPELERLVMEEVWLQGEATVRSVREALNAGAGQPERAYTTVLTILQRLDAKGLVERERADKADVYHAGLPARRVPARARRRGGHRARGRVRRARPGPVRPQDEPAGPGAPRRAPATRSGMNGVRRLELALALLAASAVLVAVIVALDALRFHLPMLLAGTHPAPGGHELALALLAALDALVLWRLGPSLRRQVRCTGACASCPCSRGASSPATP